MSFIFRIGIRILRTECCPFILGAAIRRRRRQRCSYYLAVAVAAYLPTWHSFANVHSPQARRFPNSNGCCGVPCALLLSSSVAASACVCAVVVVSAIVFVVIVDATFCCYCCRVFIFALIILNMLR